AVGQQRAREGVAGEAVVFLAVEREPERPRLIDRRAALGQPPTAHVGPASSRRYVATNACVAVSRTALNHRRHPAAWAHRSRNGPFGLSRMNRKSAHSSSESAAGSAGEARYAW